MPTCQLNTKIIKDLGVVVAYVDEVITNVRH